MIQLWYFKNLKHLQQIISKEAKLAYPLACFEGTMRGVYTHKLYVMACMPGCMCGGLYVCMYVTATSDASPHLWPSRKEFSTEYARLASQRASGNYLCLSSCRSTGLTCTLLYPPVRRCWGFKPRSSCL